MKLSQLDSRLSKLYQYNILDTPAEAGFDDVVRLASMICETPVALVSFVSFDRQWFKARVGFDSCQTPLDQSVCAHVVAGRELMVIPDLTQDDRTRDNPLVTGEPYIRFYAGAPLITPDDEVLGALCVIDDKIRPAGLTDRQVEALRALSRQVMTQLELRRVNAAVKNDLSIANDTAKLREQFIAILGHDLRNPLAALDAGTKLFLREAPSDEARSIGWMMQQSVMRMAALIDNVLDFAHGRLGGSFSLQREPALLGPVLEQVVAELRSAWPERRIDTSFTLETPVECDTSKVAQLFSNLLGNALTHGTADGPVEVRAASSDGAFQLVVTNPSPQIPPEVLERLFQPFVRGGDSPNRQGLGLGLFIASEIAKAHGGTLSADWRSGLTSFAFEMHGNWCDACVVAPGAK